MKHLVLLLHSGDYREAFARRERGLSEQYRHHGYALETLERVADRGCQVTVIRLHAAAAYDEEPRPGLRFVGIAPELQRYSAILAFLRDEGATHVMLRFPGSNVLAAALDAQVRVSVVLADSFPYPWRWRRNYRRLGKLLHDERVEFVANHHRASSQQLVDILHVDAQKVVPWDWPLDLVEKSQTAAKSHPGTSAPRLLYVGSLVETKGVFELLEAVRRLRSENFDVTLDLVGVGVDTEVDAFVERHALTGAVRRLGRLGCDEVLELMTQADLVCVPSRVTYPEGLPLTIYEAMASGTPIVASNHPMFRSVVREGETGFVFWARRPGRLVAAIRRAWSSPANYEAVSRRAAASYASIGLSTLWGDLVEHWVLDPDDTWIRSRSLGSPAARRSA